MVKNPDSPYYKLLRNRNNLWCVACLQWFDEYDYDQNRFLVNKKTHEQYKFENEDDAKIWLNNRFPKAEIEEEDQVWLA